MDSKEAQLLRSSDSQIDTQTNWIMAEHIRLSLMYLRELFIGALDAEEATKHNQSKMLNVSRKNSWNSLFYNFFPLIWMNEFPLMIGYPLSSVDATMVG